MGINRLLKLGLILLSIVLLVSVGMNIYLYQEGRNYYLQLNGTRLDPLGLSVYPTNSVQPASRLDKPVVVFFGDSRAADWPAPTEITDKIFVNRGIGAQTTTQALGRFPYHVLPLKPEV